MPYTREQRKVIRKVLSTGRKMGATRKEMIAAAETGLVESGFRNLNYGDADSKGWRQERQMYYKNPTNVGASAKRYFSETRKERGNYKKPAQLAQAVQRSAFPGRYAEHGEQAKDIVKAFNQGKFGGKAKRGTKGKSSSKRTSKTTTTPGTDNSELRSQLRKSVLTGKGLPDFSELLSMKEQLAAAQDIPGKTTTKTTKKTTKAKRGNKAPRGKDNTPKVKIRKDGKGGARVAVKYAGGKNITSGERTPGQNAAVGGAAGSDHLTTKKGASAADLKYGTGAQVAKRLGIKNWRKGSYARHTVKIDGRKFSVQILEDVEGHYDHTHVGIQRIR